MPDYVIPPTIHSGNASDIEDKTFPLCGKSYLIVKEAVDDFVSCPMVNNKSITLGCCIDTQSVTRSLYFENHIYFEDIFEKNSSHIKKKPNKMRLICLQHQIDLLEEEKAHIKNKSEKKRIDSLLVDLRNILNSIE